MTTLSRRELVVDNTVDGKDTKEEKTREVPDIRRYHFSWNLIQNRMWYNVVLVVDMKVFYSFHKADNIKYMWVVCRRHCGRHEQVGREAQGHESRTQARALWSFGVWELMPLAMMMICRTFISQTSNSSSSGSRQAREEPKKGKSSTYNFQDDGHISSCPVVHV